MIERQPPTRAGAQQGDADATTAPPGQTVESPVSWTPAPLKRNQTESLHYQIWQLIMQDILSGVLPAGELLPPEPELARQWGVARATLRLALRRLEYAGLLQRTRGQGTRVRSLAPAEQPPSLTPPPAHTLIADEVRTLQHQAAHFHAGLIRRQPRRRRSTDNP